MNTRNTVWALTVLGALLVDLVVGWYRPAAAQSSSGGTAGGRYQIVIGGRENGSPDVFLVDTTTGHVWSRSSATVDGKRVWDDEGTPPSGKAK